MQSGQTACNHLHSSFSHAFSFTLVTCKQAAQWPSPMQHGMLVFSTFSLVAKLQFIQQKEENTSAWLSLIPRPSLSSSCDKMADYFSVCSPALPSRHRYPSCMLLACCNMLLWHGSFLQLATTYACLLLHPSASHMPAALCAFSSPPALFLYTALWKNDCGFWNRRMRSLGRQKTTRNARQHEKKTRRVATAGIISFVLSVQVAWYARAAAARMRVAQRATPRVPYHAFLINTERKEGESASLLPYGVHTYLCCNSLLMPSGISWICALSCRVHLPFVAETQTRTSPLRLSLLSPTAFHLARRVHLYLILRACHPRPPACPSALRLLGMPFHISWQQTKPLCAPPTCHS